MGPRATVVLLGVVLVAAAGATLWWTSRSTDVADDGPRAEVPVPTDTTPAGDKPSAVRAPGRRSGGGALVGEVLVFGTDKPVAGAKVSIASADVVLDAVTQADGSFAFSRIPKADDWTLTVAAEVGEARIAGLVVVDRKTTDVGVVYLAPGFAVPGIVEDERGAPIAGAAVVVSEPRPNKGFDLMSNFRELPRTPRPAHTTASGADGRFRLTGLPPGAYLVLARKPGFATAVERSVLVAPTATMQPIRLVMAKGHQLAGRVVRGAGVPAEGVVVASFRSDDVAALLDAGMPTKALATTDAKGEFALEGLSAGAWVVMAAPRGEAMTAGEPVSVPRSAFVEIRLDGGASLSGRVTGEGDGPVAGAEVFCAGGKWLANAHTDADGRYELRGLAVGRTEMFMIHADGHCPYGAGNVLGIGDDDALELREGPNTRDAKLVVGGRVRGVVVEEGTKTPVPGAVVSVLSKDSLFGGSPVATTGDDGTFEIAGVSVGAAVLTARKSGWCQAGVASAYLTPGDLHVSGAGAKNDDQKDPGVGARIVVAKQGDVVEREVALQRAVVLKGRVLGPSGEPIAGARVAVVVVPGDNDHGDIVGFLARMAPGGVDPMRLSDADGRFEIAAPAAAGKVRLLATAPGLLRATSDHIEVGGATPPSETELRLGVGGTIEGRVTDGVGAPVEDAQVSWRRRSLFAESSFEQSIVDFADDEGDRGTTTTGADGSYRLAVVNPYAGGLTLRVRDGRHVPARRDGLAVEDAKTLRVDVTLESGLSITGRVVRADGKPVAGASVEIAREGAKATERDPSGDELTIEPDGRFRVAALAAGKYRLVGHADGAADGAPVVVAAGVEGVELRLAAQLAIAGVVKFRNGRPAAGVSVTAVPCQAAPDEEDEMPDSVDPSTTAGADGSFRIVITKPVEHDLVVDGRSRKPGVNVRPLRVKGVAAGADGVAIEVEIGLTIAGRVTAPDGATPQSGVVSWRRATEEVIAPGEAPDAEQAVDADLTEPSRTPLRDGRFELTSLAPGKYVVTVEAKPYSTQTVRVDAGERNVLVRLTKGGTVKGRVLLPNGAPAKASSVMVEDEGEEDDAAEWPDCETDADGRFVLEGVSAGVHRLVAYHTDDEEKPYQGEAKEVRVESGATVENVEIRLKKAE